MDYSIFIKQLEVLIDTHEVMKRQSEYDDLSDLPKPDRQSLVTRAIAAIHRITGSNSTYSNEVERILKTNPHLHLHTSSIIGIAKALKEDIAAGYLQNLTQLVRADIFTDFLEMAEHLLKESYKDASAVITGSVLENSLRKLAEKNEIPIVNEKGKHLTIEPLNVELAKKEVYNKLVQKQVTSWAELRNNAAHGHFDKYDKNQVEMMLLFVEKFCMDYD